MLLIRKAARGLVNLEAIDFGLKPFCTLGRIAIRVAACELWLLEATWPANSGYLRKNVRSGCGDR